mmetsp:Transcript_14939/g.37868  ORF Transcript_14939/g.37868 Transcript_14939/m.37868 type:complete len:225 (-) Transcript_14939:423-1097(-)
MPTLARPSVKRKVDLTTASSSSAGFVRAWTDGSGGRNGNKTVRNVSGGPKVKSCSSCRVRPSFNISSALTVNVPQPRRVRRNGGSMTSSTGFAKLSCKVYRTFRTSVASSGLSKRSSMVHSWTCSALDGGGRTPRGRRASASSRDEHLYVLPNRTRCMLVPRARATPTPFRCKSRPLSKPPDKFVCKPGRNRARAASNFSWPCMSQAVSGASTFTVVSYSTRPS